MTESSVTHRGETELNVLWSSSGLIALSKPAGIATQAPSGVDSLEARLRNELTPQPEYLAFPHRLDRPVSGVILVATSKRAAKLIGAQFESRKVMKTYIGIVAGNASEIEREWCDFLLKQPDTAKVDLVDSGASGAKACETSVEVLGYNAQHDCTVLRLRPRTGRMHQLRVQSSSRGFPLVGDVTYGWASNSATPFHPLRIALHAESLSFHEPSHGRWTTVSAPLDAEMSEWAPN